MYIFGAILFMVLPYLAGYSCKSILRWKETNQIETYLIGFFLLFFLQAVIFIPFVWTGKCLTDAVGVMYATTLVLLLLYIVFVVIGYANRRKKETKAVKKPTDAMVLASPIFFLPSSREIKLPEPWPKK